MAHFKINVQKCFCDTNINFIFSRKPQFSLAFINFWMITSSGHLMQRIRLRHILRNTCKLEMMTSITKMQRHFLFNYKRVQDSIFCTLSLDIDQGLLILISAKKTNQSSP
jgi:hypothetical protein